MIIRRTLCLPAIQVALLSGALPASSSALPTIADAWAVSPGKRSVLDLGRYGFFLGTWSGAGTFQRTGKAVASELVVAPVAGDEAIELRYRELPPNKFAYAALWSLDTIASRPVMLMAGNNGGGARVFRAVEADADRLVFVTQPGLRAWFGFERMTFRRVAADHLEVTYEFSHDGSAWAVGDVQDFVRQRAS